MRKSIKSRKQTFKTLHNFVRSLTDKPIGDKQTKLLVFSDKILHVWISSEKPRVCQKPRGSPGVGYCPTLGTDIARKCPADAPGVSGAGIDLSMHYTPTSLCGKRRKGREVASLSIAIHMNSTKSYFIIIINSFITQFYFKTN